MRFTQKICEPIGVLYAFGFDHLGVVLSDLYFVDPNPGKGQEGPERGVRLEVRMLDRGSLHGSIYSAQPISVARPVWRLDLLESVAGPFGSFDRTHHHPRFRGWEPGARVFDEGLSASPLDWAAARLTDVEGLLDAAGVGPDEVTAADVSGLRAAVPEIMEAVRRQLARIAAGGAGQAPTRDEELVSARIGWL
jgi:hypothetical protein